MSINTEHPNFCQCQDCRHRRHIRQLQRELVEESQRVTVLENKLKASEKDTSQALFAHASTVDQLTLANGVIAGQNNALESIRKDFAAMRESGCSCYSNPEEGCVYCSAIDRIENALSCVLDVDESEDA